MSPFITARAVRRVPRENVSHDEARVMVGLNMVMLVLASCAVLAYLILLNTLVSRSYAVKELQEHMTTLAESREELTRSLTAMRSLEGLEARVAGLGLVAADRLDFPRPAAAVAQRAPAALE